MLFPLFGFSINSLSLFGLVLAIGLVVDDAIVVVEAVERHIEEGMTPREATLQAMREVSGPVIGIALVLSAVQDKPAQEVAQTDIAAQLAPFELSRHLSANRTQGVPNMIALVKETAERYAAAA